MYDVIIIGAGPAGGTAAYYLAKGGAKVLLLERNKLPRFKPCGGGISLKFLSSLPFDVSTAITGKVSKIRYFYNMDDPFEVELDSQIAMLNRKKFDYLIAEKAAYSGAELFDCVQINDISFTCENIEVLTNKGNFNSKYLIGADGVHSYVGKCAGLIKNREFFTALEVELPHLHHDINTAYFGFGQLSQGYVWSFPKKDYFSIGIGGVGRNKIDELKRWLNFLGYNAEAKKTRIYSHPLPEVIPGDRLQKQNTLLIGDAAGLVDPLSGEGIRYAINSARIASSVILEETLDEYSQRIYREISSDFKFAYRLRWFFFRFPQFSYSFAVKDANHSRVLAKIIAGELGYKYAFGRFINKSFNPFRLFKKYFK